MIYKMYFAGFCRKSIFSISDEIDYQNQKLAFSKNRGACSGKREVGELNSSETSQNPVSKC
jgi:hypothetical protein